MEPKAVPNEKDSIYKIGSGEYSYKEIVNLFNAIRNISKLIRMGKFNFLKLAVDSDLENTAKTLSKEIRSVYINLCKSAKKELDSSKRAEESDSERKQRFFNIAILKCIDFLHGREKKFLLDYIQHNSKVAINSFKPRTAEENESANRNEYSEILVSGQDAIDCIEANVAIAYIILGEIYRLDPVIGDAACEMRPSFILDMHKKIIPIFNELKSESKIVQEQARSYCSKVKEFKEEKSSTKSDVSEGASKKQNQDSPLYNIDKIDKFYEDLQKNHPSFASFCKKAKVTIKPDPKYSETEDDHYLYLGLCKTMTRTRKMLYDRYGISLGDEQNNPFKNDKIRGTYKKKLGDLCVQYMREIADRIGGEDKKYILNQVLEEFKECKALFSTDTIQVPVLPIYSAMRLLLSYECSQKRPIIIILNRLKTKKSSVSMQFSEKENEALLKKNEPLENMEICSFESKIIFYQPDPMNGTYTLKDNPNEDEKNTPCTVYECYSIYSKDAPKFKVPGIPDDLLGEDDEAFFTAFKACDISKLILLYAASHPPMSNRGKVTFEQKTYSFLNDSGLAYIKNVQNKICTNVPAHGLPSLESTDLVNINIDQLGNLSQEFDTHREKSKLCGMLYEGDNAPAVTYHSPVKFPDQFETDNNYKYRYDKNIFFRISHILPSTYAVSLARVEEAKATSKNYKGGKLINYTNPSNSFKDAQNNGTDSFYRDDN